MWIPRKQFSNSVNYCSLSIDLYTIVHTLAMVCSFCIWLLMNQPQVRRWRMPAGYGGYLLSYINLWVVCRITYLLNYMILLYGAVTAYGDSGWSRKLYSCISNIRKSASSPELENIQLGQFFIKNLADSQLTRGCVSSGFRKRKWKRINCKISVKNHIFIKIWQLNMNKYTYMHLSYKNFLEPVVVCLLNSCVMFLFKCQWANILI